MITCPFSKFIWRSLFPIVALNALDKSAPLGSLNPGGSVIICGISVLINYNFTLPNWSLRINKVSIFEYETD